MRFISSFASGHKLPSQLVKELISALSCCSGPFVGCFPRVWGTWVSWCLRGGQQTRWSIKPAVGHWVWCPCFWGIPQPMWDESGTARGLPSIKSCSQKIVEAGMWFIIQLLHSHFSIQNRSPPLCICVFWHMNVLKGIKPSHHLLWDHNCLHILSLSFW